jgi:flavodoxin
MREKRFRDANEGAAAARKRGERVVRRREARVNLEIYYFSGTGNTLTVAREIASRTGARLIPVQKVIERATIAVGAPNLCIVFPSYLAPASGVPMMVLRFVKKIANLPELRVFAVCTCGGYEIVNALPSLHAFERVVRSLGGRVWAAHSVRLPMNNIDYDHIPVPIERDSGVIIQRSRAKIAAISDSILEGRSTYTGPRRKRSSFFCGPCFAPFKNLS